MEPAGGPSLGVERAAPLEDAGDRADGRRRSRQVDHGFELTADRRWAVFAEDALLTERPADVEDPVLQIARRSPNVTGDRWPIAPVDLVEGTIECPLQPELDGRERDAELGRDGALRSSRANGRHHCPTLPRRPVIGRPLRMSPTSAQLFLVSVLTGRL